MGTQTRKEQVAMTTDQLTPTDNKSNGGLTLTVETITPQIAARYLEENVSNNRSISDRHVSALARDMVADRWSQNGETLKFSPVGALLDGQQRLWACIQASKSFTTAVVRGVTSLDDVDRSRPRTLGHALQMHGYEQPRRLGVALSTAWRWENTSWRMQQIRPTTQEAIRFLQQNEPQLYSAMRAGSRLHKIESSLENASLVFWRMARTFGQEVALDAYERLSKSMWKSLHDPLYQYYHLAIRAKVQARKPHKMVKLNWLVRAMDAAVNNEEYAKAHFLRWDGSKELRSFTGEDWRADANPRN
jgi:hypothetical protein